MLNSFNINMRASCWVSDYCVLVGLSVGCLVSAFPDLLLIVSYMTGKDKIIFVTKEDHETPSSAELVADDPDDPYEEQGQ